MMRRLLMSHVVRMMAKIGGVADHRARAANSEPPAKLMAVMSPTPTADMPV